MYGIIYKVTNKINKKVYIGQTIQSLQTRKYYHFYRAQNEPDIIHTHFINALRKYKKDDFIWQIIDQAESQKQLNQKQKYWIKFYDSVNTGYNIQAGGNDYDTEKFALACGSKPFLAYRANGEFLGQFINRKNFGRKYGVADSNIASVLNHKYNSCNGYIFIYKDEFTEQKIQQMLAKVKNSFRPIIAINLKTFEQFGPYNSILECRKALKLKYNHVGEVLKGKRKSQEGFTFKFFDEINK